MEIVLNRRQYLEFEKIALGAFAPLTGFMREDEFLSSVEQMRLPRGSIFPLPVVFDISADMVRAIKGASKLTLLYQGQEVGEMIPESVFSCDRREVAIKVFGTPSVEHPGVAALYSMANSFVGGEVKLVRRVEFDFSPYEWTPIQTRTYFANKGWTTVVGFQTRNIPHRAHEYLQRLALEQADGLFIQPLVGPRKRGDYTPAAILKAYGVLIERFLPRERVLLGILSAAMRYAGPREAVFHAIIRRNYGCTHFIVGRDHAGVGGYYNTYAAHDLTRRFEGELGITILRLCGPYYCRRCDGIVTERTCPHGEAEPQAIQQISGSALRAALLDGGSLPAEFVRPEIVASLKGVPLFIEEGEE